MNDGHCRFIMLTPIAIAMQKRPAKRCGKSGILLPKISLGFWVQLREEILTKEVVPSLTMPSTMVSPTSTWLTTMDLHTEVQRKRWAD